MTRYDELVAKLFNVNFFGGMKLGLRNMLHLDAALGYPSKAFKTIHVAGSNGKGSTSKKIASALELAGQCVGLFTSPHISCFRERIQINGFYISEEAVETLLSQLFALAEQEKISPTFFEFTTLLALRYFAEQNVDVAVLETGLGGRLDATNIVTPLLSVITSISLEHTEILGETIEEIAIEKGGIIKPGIPVIVGPRTPHLLLHQMAQKISSPFIPISQAFSCFEEENRAIARTALESLSIPSAAIKKGVESSLPCRMEIFTQADLPRFHDLSFPKCVILDVAHNADGLSHLFQAIGKKFPKQKLRVIFGLSKTKDVSACLAILKKNAHAFHLVEAPNGRGISAGDLKEKLQVLGIPENHLSIAPTIAESLHQATEAAAHQNELLVVCGTFFIMHPVRHALGIEELQDDYDMNERMR